MTSVLGKDPRCSIARSLEVLGEKWTLLVVREAFRGRTRFSEFADALGIARDVLSSRLATLVEFGVLERRAYRAEGSRERAEYVLTASGRELVPVLAALNAWGDAYRATEWGPATVYADAQTGEPVSLRFVTESGRILDLDEVTAHPGPAFRNT